MKKHWILKLTLFVALGIFAASCSDETKETVSPTADITATIDDADTDETFALIDSEVDVILLEEAGNLGRTKDRTCPSVEIDSVNHVLTLDFGDVNCSKNDKEFRGKIIINYTGRPSRVGASRIITFEDFYVNDNKVEGTRTIENTRLDDRGGIVQTVTLVGGKITLTDGKTIEKEANWTRSWLRGDTTTVSDDEFHLDGTASGKTRNDINYNVEILTTLVWKRECRTAGIHIPVSGIKQISSDNRATKTIDFGDGTCNRTIVITVNGVSKTITLRGRK